MIPNALLFYRLIVRPLLREPGRALLTLFAITLGVAVVLAIELSGNAAAGSFRSSMETLAGRNDLEVTATGGVPDGVAAKLARLPYPFRLSARIEDHATLPNGVTVPLIGLDLIGEANREASDNNSNVSGKPQEFADARKSLEHLADPDSIWVSANMGLEPGDKLPLLINDRTQSYTVRGVLPSGDAWNGDAIVMDIGAAQRATGRIGRVDRILIRLPDTNYSKAFSLEEWESVIRAALPAGVSLNPQGARTEANRKMLAAFRWNLRILSYVALVVGAFLIYNTVSLSVVRRRAEIGILRALGASRRAVLLAFLGEAICFGIVGALLALPLGRVLAAGSVKLLATTVESLYVSSRPGTLSLGAFDVVLGLIIGVSVAVASALAPAREASFVMPTEAMARAQREYAVRVHRGRDLVFAVVLGVVSALASQAPPIAGKPLFGYAAALLLIAASALAMPSLVYGLTAATSQVLRKLLGVEALLASRSLAGSLRRTAVLVGALSTAVAMMTSVGIMVGSFRQTVVSWMESQLPADLYMRPAGSPAADRHPTISEALIRRIEQLPGVSGVDRFRGYEIEYQGKPATLASVQAGVSRYYRSSGFLSGRSARTVLDELQNSDAAIVSEPFAYKHNVHADDMLTLAIGNGIRHLRVVDVFRDYASERGYIIVDRATMMRWLPDDGASNLAIYVTPGANIAAVRHEVEQASAGYRVMLFSNGELRREAIRIFDQTFAITYALEAVAVFVAVVGIAGALVSIVLDRRREFGVLRFL
ncbi:MAG TPA: ABC transporter permease, partial [Candidatus Acidoferrales bacterium]|nr:ABC transporter permease [Candidatus Acidoferrales bacterium]